MQAYDVYIKPANNDGYVMQIGCKTYIIPKTSTDVHRIMDKVAAYLLYPQAAIREACKDDQPQEARPYQDQGQGLAAAHGTVGANLAGIQVHAER